MDFLGFLGSSYTFMLAALLVVGLGLALMALIRYVIGRSDSGMNKTAQGGVSVNNWLRYAMYSFLGILLLVAIMGMLAPSGPMYGNYHQGNMSGMQNPWMGSMGMMNMGSSQSMGGMQMQQPMGNMGMSGMGMGAMPMQGMGNMGMSGMGNMGGMGGMMPMGGMSSMQGTVQMNGLIVMPLPNGGVAVMPMNSMASSMPSNAMPMNNGPMSGGGGMMGMMPMMGGMSGGSGGMGMGGMSQMGGSGGGMGMGGMSGGSGGSSGGMGMM